MKRIVHIITFLAILACTYLAFRSLLPPEISGMDTPDTEFSTARALTHLKEITKEPHFTGSEAHADVRDYIVAELTKMGLEPQVQEGVVVDRWFGFTNLVKPQNILARIKGSGEGKAVLLMSHYDSAPQSASHGASDAGSGVVTILEGVRAFLATGKTPKNDIIICITDAEELGLNGASLFVNEHPWAKDAAIALNFEARGSGGPSNMIVETNGGNANLIKGFQEADVRYPVATSLMYSIYKMLPNDTDSTILREDGDIDGFFFAFIDDHYDYHTQNDTYERLDRNSLEHQGSYIMPLLTYYANADLSTVKATEDYVYFDMAFVKFAAYPFSWVLPMAILGVVLFIVLLVYGFRKKRLSGLAIGRGFAAFSISLIGGAGLTYLLWVLIKLIYPAYEDMLPVFIYNGHWYILGFVALATAFCFGIYARFTKVTQVPSTMVAPITFWLIVNLGLAFGLVGAGFFIIPVYFALVAFWVLIRQQNPNAIVMLLLVVPAIFIFAPLVQFFPVGLGPDMMYAAVILLVLLFGLLIPIVGFYRSKKTLGWLCILSGIVFFSIAHSLSSPNSERQAPNSLVYYHNVEEGKAYYATYNTVLDEWTRSYLGDNPEDASKYIGNAAGSKYNTRYAYAKETEVIQLPESYVSITNDTVIDGYQYNTLKVMPNRTVHQMRLYAPQDVVFSHLAYNGKVLTPDSTATLFKKRGSKSMLSYYRSPEDTLVVNYAVKEGEAPIFSIKEFSFDLLENPKFNTTPRPERFMPSPFITNDAIIIERDLKSTVQEVEEGK